MTRYAPFIGALALLALPACSTDPESPGEDPAKPLPASSSSELTRTLDDIVAAKVAPGVSIAVRHPSYRAWSGASGVADLANGTALTSERRFRAGSMLKIMVATAVLQLVEQDELSLDTALDQLLPPEVVTRLPEPRAITVRMLLNHTSGLPEFTDDAFHAEVFADPTHVWTLDELLDRALAHPVLPPGGAYSYTNTGYILLGKILEQKLGRPWRSLLRESVFSRAQLEHSELPEAGNPLCDGCSRGYFPVEASLIDLTEVDPSMAGASGGDALISTPSDLARFLEALFAGRLFDKPTTLPLMLDFIAAPVPEEAQDAYALGLARFQVGPTTFIGHLGSTAGFQGFVLHAPSNGLTVSGYMNRTGNLGAFIVPVLQAAARIE